MPNKLHDIVRGLGNAIKLSGRTFLAPHRGSSPKGRGGSITVYPTLFDGRWHAPSRCARNGVSLDFSVALLLKIQFACTYCLRHFPPKGEASRYGANIFLNLIALGYWGHFMNGVSHPPLFTSLSAASDSILRCRQGRRRRRGRRERRER